MTIHAKTKIPYRPAHNYPTTYSRSRSEIEFTADGHGHICGTGKRTGLTLLKENPVYELHSWFHPEINGMSVVLTPDGFELREPAPSQSKEETAK